MFLNPLVQPGTHRQAPSRALSALVAEVWRHKFVVPAVAIVVTGAIAFWTVRQPKVYEAVATLEYDPNPAQPLGSAVEDTTGSSYNYWDTQEFYETQNFILRSRTLAEQVVKTLGLQHDSSFAPGGGSVSDVASQLMGSLQIEQVRDTRVVRIRARDRKPERAQLIANALVDAYIEKSLQDRVGSSARALEWLGTQMQNLKRDLESSELALYKFREDNDSLSSSLAERQRVLATQMQRYTETLTEIRSRRVQTEARLSVLKELLATQPDLLAVHASPITGDSAIEALRAKLREAADQIDRLSITYGEAHPQVKAAMAARESLWRQLQGQVTAIVRGIEGELDEYIRAEKGVGTALNEVNRQGLQLSLQEIEYTRLDRERISKAELYNLVMQRTAQTDLTRALRLANGRPVDRAVTPSYPVSPRVQLSIVLGGLLGLVMGVLTALLIAQLDNKVRGPADMEARGIPVLGVMPTIAAGSTLASNRNRRHRGRRVESPQRDLVVHLEPRSTTAECCRTIRTNITFQAADRPLNTIAVTSAMPRDGKTAVSISIATVLAQSGKKVLLVDTDLRKPRLHRAFGLPAGEGVTSVLAGQCTLPEAVQTTEIPGLTLLQCGPIPPNPSELLHTRRFNDLLQETRSLYDVVMFDTPPLGAVTDPAIIATQVDGTIVVVRSRSTTRAGVEAALRQLNGVSARIVGAVLNGVDLNDSSYGTYYAYQGGYYAEAEDEPVRKNTLRNSV